MLPKTSCQDNETQVRLGNANKQTLHGRNFPKSLETILSGLQGFEVDNCGSLKQNETFYLSIYFYEVINLLLEGWTLYLDPSNRRTNNGTSSTNLSATIFPITLPLLFFVVE